MESRMNSYGERRSVGVSSENCNRRVVHVPDIRLVLGFQEYDFLLLPSVGFHGRVKFYWLLYPSMNSDRKALSADRTDNQACRDLASVW